MVGLGEQLAKLRRKQGLSQEELARTLGVSRQAVSNWEREEAVPDLDNLLALANFYGTTLDALVGRNRTSTPHGNATARKQMEGDDAATHDPQEEGSTLKNTLIGLAAVLIPFAALLGMAVRGGMWNTVAGIICVIVCAAILGWILRAAFSTLRSGIAKAWRAFLETRR